MRHSLYEMDGFLGGRVGGCWFGMWVLLFGFGGSGERDVGRGDGIGGCGMVWFLGDLERWIWVLFTTSEI